MAESYYFMMSYSYLYIDSIQNLSGRIKTIINSPRNADSFDCASKTLHIVYIEAFPQFFYLDEIQQAYLK